MQALLLEQQDGKTLASVQTLDESRLPEGDVTTDILQTLLQPGHIVREMPDLMPQPILGFVMLLLEAGEPRQFGIDTGLLNDHWIAGSDGLYFGVGKGHPVYVLNATKITFTRHDLGDESRFGFEGLP